MRALRIYIIFSTAYIAMLMYYDNKIQESASDNHWHACVMGYNLAIQNFTQTKRLTEKVSGDMFKEGQKLCTRNISELGKQ